MIIALKKRVRTLLNKAGWELHRYRPSSDPWALVGDIIRRHDIDLVIDVGANIGQYGRDLRRHGYRGRIVSFEPLSSAHSRLQANSAGDTSWTVAPRCAIGSSDGEITINVSENSVSSSVLPLSDALTSSAPGAKYVQAESTPLKTLDRALSGLIGPSHRAFLKIDTQGYESEVLKGAVSTLMQTAAICVEASLVPLYAGQPLWLSIIEQLERAGWMLWDVSSAFSDPTTGQLLQVDMVFTRPLRRN